jgi:hypothetical protein
MIEKNDYAQLRFVALLTIIFWVSYFVVVSLSNVFQDYSFQHHFKPGIFVWKNIVALRISFFVTLLLYIKKLQSLQYQRRIFMIALLLLGVGLCFPLSLDIYPFVSGMARVVSGLTEPWMQLYVPSAYRATIEGVVIGFTGVLDILAIWTENSWTQHLSRYHYMAIIFLISLIPFWIASHHNKKHKKISAKLHHRPQIPTKSVIELLKEHPYIFIAFFFGGLNIALFDYTYLLAKEAMPHRTAEIYQYALYAGSILGPIVIGRIADKKGIFFTFVMTAILVVANKFAQAFYFKISINFFELYYFSAFAGSALAATVATLSLALMGERLCHQGIFRAFVLTGIFFDVANLVAGRIYEWFADSFFLTNMSMGSIDLFLLLFLWKFYRKDRESKHLLVK